MRLKISGQLIELQSLNGFTDFLGEGDELVRNAAPIFFKCFLHQAHDKQDRHETDEQRARDHRKGLDDKHQR